MTNRTGRRIVGIGGTVRTLATAAQFLQSDPVDLGVQGYSVPREVLGELIERLAALPASRRVEVPGIKPARADLILAGAVVVDSVLELGGFETIEVTEAGLREGVFFSRLLDGDPPLFEDVRRSSVLNLAAQYEIEPRHTAHVAELALGLFDELARIGLHAGDAVERELLWSACVLHDIGLAVDYDDHHKHSRYLVLHSGLPGFSQREVALIGQVVRYHRKGLPSLGPLGKLCAEGDELLLDRCALLLRLAEGLERSRDQAVSEVVVKERKSGAIELRLMAGDDSVTVARWAAAREGALFERTFGRPLQIT
jgi:exopolyphosphatase/guanosine-5'-triphosphate,3'-diphosphate pyrophosphatase